MRCPRCGNENPGPNRFCGMCGATLLAAPAPSQQQPVPVSTPNATTAELTAARSEPAKPARVEPPPNNHPSISGPSFLGLNDPSPSHAAPRTRARLSIDPHSAPGSNLEYLLDDEEQPHHWGPGKILLIMIALVLALGFGYLRWKTHGFAWLNPPTKKPDAAVQNAPPSDNGAAQPTPAPAPEAQQPAIQPIQPAPTPAQPSPDAAASNTTPASNPPSNPPASATHSASPTPESSPKPSDTASDADNSPAPDNDSSAPTEPAAEAPPKAVEKPKPAPRPATPKPSPAKPVVAADPVAEAQRYLYGKGVAQDCDRGMRLLKPAANQANAKAMVEMGALYSAGLCTPHDLPTAYRWFAMALRKDPENAAVQADLSKLWSEMTPPERQLAIKLTQ